MSRVGAGVVASGVLSSRGEAWEEAELAPLRGLEAHGMRDLFRDPHGYEKEAISFAA